jgi:hypothetical protein
MNYDLGLNDLKARLHADRPDRLVEFSTLEARP